MILPEFQFGDRPCLLAPHRAIFRAIGCWLFALVAAFTETWGVLELTDASNFMNTPIVSTSKFLSLILRHQPEKIGLCLDANGWANIDDLLRQSAAKGKPLTPGAHRRSGGHQ